MIILNRQSNQNVKEATVRNFYPKNPPKTSSHTTIQSYDNMYNNHHHNHMSQSVSPQNQISMKRYDDYKSAYGSPKYNHHINHSQSQQLFSSTAPMFFQPQKSVVLSSQNSIKPSINNQQQTSINNKLTTEELGKQKLLDARKNRQQTELNVNSLKNRIHLLELKEKQTMVKMVETQKKTIDIITNKTNHQEKLKAKNELLLQKQEEMIRRQLELKQAREEKKLKEQMLKQERVKSAQLQAKRIKDLKEIYSTHQQFMQEEMWLRNAQSYETIKLQEKEQELKRQQMDSTKKNIAHEMYKNKCKSEINKKAQSEFQYMELERREQELLKKLQASQNLQSAAIQELQRVRQTPQSKSNLSSLFLKNDSRNYYMA